MPRTPLAAAGVGPGHDSFGYCQIDQGRPGNSLSNVMG